MPNWQYTKGLHELGNGHYAYLVPDGSWGWSNAGLVEDGGETLLVDTLFDLKLAKNIRFGSKRATVGVDIYNVFNSDAIQDYNDTWTLDNPATPEDENLWGDPSGLVSPRFVRASVQFYF